MTQDRPIGRREQAKAAKRARILAAADRLFSEQGYAGTTTQQIADAADVASGTVFTYAATKAELLLMVVNHRLRDGAARGLARAERVAEPVAATMALLAPLFELAVADPDTFVLFAREVLFGAEGEHRSEAVAAVTQIGDAIGSVLPLRSGIDPTDAGRAVLSVVLFELNRIRRGASPAGRDRVAAQVALVLYGLCDV
ncbi:TetR/AcrR family transcriptional regulator [Naumannella sp. ID2617S]|nr:TetR/AcrR family transcriptional regulator [Naumannella sp. ID2617S]